MINFSISKILLFLVNCKILFLTFHKFNCVKKAMFYWFRRTGAGEFFYICKIFPFTYSIGERDTKRWSGVPPPIKHYLLKALQLQLPL